MTSKITIPSGNRPTILIESVGEDVRIRGHALDEIIVSMDDVDSLEYETHTSGTAERSIRENEQKDSIPSSESTSNEANNEKDGARKEKGSSDNVIEIGPIAGDSIFDVPINAQLRIGQIGGDAQLRSIHGKVEIESVGEDLSATKIGSLTIKSIGSDASIKRIDGNVTIENVGDDANFSDIEGDLSVTAGGDLSMIDIRGNLNAKVGEDSMLRFPLVEGRQYNVIAGGDIACYLPDDTSAEVMLRSGTRTLRVRGWEVPEPPEDELYTFTLGEGGASLNLNAGEDISLVNQDVSGGPTVDFDFDFDFGPGFQFRFDSDNFRPEQFSNLFSEKIQDKVQNAMRQAEASIANAIAHAESRIANAEQHASDFETKWTGRRSRGPKRRRSDRPAEDRRRREYRRKNRHHGPARQSGASREEASMTEAERLMVLRMVEEGKISVEQAEKLLSAMGS